MSVGQLETDMHNSMLRVQSLETNSFVKNSDTEYYAAALRYT